MVSRTDSSLELVFKDTDFSLLRIIQTNLLNDKRVKNISVKRGHPLTKDVYLFILTDGSDPKLVLKEGIEKSKEMAKSLKEELENALSRP
ncbi:MAG: RpoL/Rpb11 RNA polymerase subunit family protein [Nitrososphaeria archaeon]